jgi:hypothetical protein
MVDYVDMLLEKADESWYPSPQVLDRSGRLLNVNVPDRADAACGSGGRMSAKGAVTEALSQRIRGVGPGRLPASLAAAVIGTAAAVATCKLLRSGS